MKDTLIGLAIITVAVMFAVTAVTHIISLWGEPDEIIGTAITSIIN